MIVLLLIYNPTLTFIVPGLVLMAISVTGAVLLSNGPVHTSYLGLNIHSFIVAALGVLAAFQLVIFGVAAALYGVEAGKQPPRWLRRVISVRFRLGVGLLGLVLLLGSIGKLIQLTIQWAGNNVFTDTRGLVLTDQLPRPRPAGDLRGALHLDLQRAAQPDGRGGRRRAQRRELIGQTPCRAPIPARVPLRWSRS